MTKKENCESVENVSLNPWNMDESIDCGNKVKNNLV